MADLSKLERDLAALERDSTLHSSDNLAARFEALKTLDFLGEAYQIQAGQRLAASGLRRVRALQGDLGELNLALFRKLRIGIRSRTMKPGQLRALLESNCRYRRGGTACMHWGAEAADALAAGIFRSDCVPQPWDGGDVEMIHYESTPVSAVLELVDRVPLTGGDRFVDIGSGLGQVVFLVNLLTGVEAVGLEVVPAYVEQARGEAERLGIGGVSFREGDARSADLRGGTVYFLFSPFRGQMLQTVLTRLGQEARTRRFTVCSFGPCTEQIAGETWLTLQEAAMNHEFRLAIFHSDS
ncbi:MAG: hypothetical protein OXO50_24065 [Caldilineaceae bacterium]|nr:hypothetical protein [Caldilineaceae bacterium]